MIAVDLIKQQELDADAKAIQQMSFTGNLNQGENVNDNTVFFVIEKVKETVLDFWKMTVRVSFSCIIKMTQYNMLNVKLSNSKHNKLKSAIKKWNPSNFKSFIKYCWWF